MKKPIPDPTPQQFQDLLRKAATTQVVPASPPSRIAQHLPNTAILQ